MASVVNVVAFSQRGIHKRIDENRELLDLLQRAVPDLLRRAWWIEGWLASQDEFLTDLAIATELGLPHRDPTIHPREAYPRPWPGRLTDSEKKEPV
nr:hypothetical protein [Paraburkholderia aspalathi]